jgi:hypothetical protein
VPLQYSVNVFVTEEFDLNSALVQVVESAAVLCQNLNGLTPGTRQSVWRIKKRTLDTAFEYGYTQSFES